MNRPSAKPYHDPSTLDLLRAVKGADKHHGRWCLVAHFPAFEGLVDGPRENAWRLRRIHEQTAFHHEREFSIVSLQKKHSLAQSLCHQEVSFEHLFVCLLHRFSLCARVAHVGERVQMVFSKRSQMPSHASLCEHCSLSPSSAKEAVPVWREVFISSFRDLFSHHCSEKTAGNVDDTCDQHSFLSVMFVDQGAV